LSRIYVSFFGEFSIVNDDKKICEKNISSKKSITLLEYLIAFRKKEISSLELIEVLWSDECENPTSALKTLLHRTRHILSELQLNDNIKLINSVKGTYCWNNQIDTVVDSELFEQCYKELKKESYSDFDKIEMAMKAIQLYKGTFLSNSSSEYWVVTLSTYFNSLYIEIINIAIELLEKENRHIEIIDICKNAIAINPYEEDFHYNLINSLYESGSSQIAIEQYKYVEDFFYQNFGINLSEKFVTLYNKICNTKKYEKQSRI